MLAPDSHRTDAAREAARADLCRFIAACYYEPDAAFVEERLFASMRQAAACIDPELEAIAARLGPAFDAQPLQDLLVDYTRLFLGPAAARAQPYASVWLEGQERAAGEGMRVVLALYEEGDFAIADDFADLPDHVAAELEFLYLLIFRENEARSAGNGDALARHAALRRRLLDEHLKRWLPPFVQAVRTGAETAFYEALADLTETFARLEAARG